jgi:uncharacterized protein YjbI with pentapeptide repeats
MANVDHLDLLLTKGVEAWNLWRSKDRVYVTVDPDKPGDPEDLITLLYPDVGRPDLRKAKLAGAELVGVDFSLTDLIGADLRGANLHKASFFNARLFQADLTGALLDDANFFLADLAGAHLSEACLLRAKLNQANLNWAELRNACLREAELKRASLVGADLGGADLTGCRVHGVNVWGIELDEGTKQQNLVITEEGESEITADDIEVAQFIYLLLHNQKVRGVIDTITSKVVLILGRFTDERKVVLDALRDELRKRDHLPVLFDFPRPESRDVTETVKVLAGLARFVIADITDATEVRTEVSGIVPIFTSLPVQPILLRGQAEFIGMQHLKAFPWLLPTFEYDSQEHLLSSLNKDVIGPAETKALELRRLLRKS